jgi:hypothetical protein
MLKTTNKAAYDRDEKDFALRYAALYAQANLVLIPEQVTSAKRASSATSPTRSPSSTTTCCTPPPETSSR